MSSPGIEAVAGRPGLGLRIVHVLRESSYGTASTVAEIVPALRRLGATVDVVLLSNGNAGAPSASNRLEDAGVAFQRIPIAEIRRWMRPAFLFKLADPVRIARQLADVETDVLHCHGPLPLAAGLLRRRHCAVVTTFHGMTNPRSLSQRTYRAAVGLADAVIALKAEDARAIRRFRRAARVQLAQNGIDASRWTRKVAAADTLRNDLGISQDAFVVGLAGRLSREKGIEPFLLAVARSGWLERADVHIVVAGTGPEEEHLKNVLAELPILAERAHLLGYRPDVETLLRTVDAVAIPSETESQPMVALEAMACGVPVAAFAVGALPEMLADGAGLLVPRGAFDHLTDALDRLRTSPEERVAIIDAARRRVRESYDADTVARDLLETIYRPLIAKKRT